MWPRHGSGRGALYRAQPSFDRHRLCRGHRRHGSSGRYAHTGAALGLAPSAGWAKGSISCGDDTLAPRFRQQGVSVFRRHCRVFRSMRRLATIAAAALLGASCASRQAAVSTASAAASRDSVSLRRTESANLVRTVTVGRPRIVIEHIDSPRRRITVTAEVVRDSATAVAETAVAADSTATTASAVERDTRSRRSPAIPAWVWMAVGAAAGVILRSSAGIRSRR